MSTPFTKLDTIILPALDLDALSDWYERLLGVPPRLRNEWIASFPLGDTSLTLERQDDSVRANHTYPILYAPDINAAYTVARELGARLGDLQRPEAGFAYFEATDPQGNKFNVCSY